MLETIGTIIHHKTKPGLGRSIEAAIVVAKATDCGQGRWQAVKFRAGRLTIVAASAGAAQDLVLRKQEVIDSVNQALGEQRVKHLIVRTK